MSDINGCELFSEPNFLNLESTSKKPEMKM
jgi:hypothetical protein